MKKKPFLWRSVMLLMFCGVIVALLEVFDLHPQFSIGKFHSIWLGVRHMDFMHDTMVVRGPGGTKVLQRDYGVGPVQITIGG